MATASDLIKGEALVAQSGNINYGEEIGKGFETITESIAEAKSTISNWGEKESELNEAMALVDTDDVLSQENEAIVEFLTMGKLKYQEAAKKASRIANKSSKEYKNLVKIMNDVNTSFKNLAKEKQDILDARAYVKENPNAFSAANNLNEDALAYFNAVTGKASMPLNEKGHFVIGNKEFRNLKSPSTKSLINKATAQVLTGAYDKVKKDGKELTNNELENAANGLVASIMETDNHLLATQQFLLDPIYGGVSLATEEEVKGKNKEELIVLAKDRYKQLLREQSSKGKNDYVVPEKPGSRYEQYFESDEALKGLAEFVETGGEDGSPVATIGTKRYKVITEEKDVEGTDSKKKVYKIIKLIIDPNTSKVIPGGESINVYKKDGTLNFSGFRPYTGSTQKQRAK